MDSLQNRNIVTPPESSEAQGAAGVSGEGNLSGTNVAGSPRSASCNREQKIEDMVAEYEKLREERNELYDQHEELHQSVLKAIKTSTKEESSSLEKTRKNVWARYEDVDRRIDLLDAAILEGRISVAANTSGGEAARLASLAEVIAADLWCPPDNDGDTIDRLHVMSLALSEAAGKWKAEQQLLEDEEFRMPRKEVTPTLISEHPRKRMKAFESPLSERSIGVAEGSLDDDGAIDVGIRAALAQVTTLSREVEAAHAEGEIRGHIAESVSALLQTVTGISDFWSLRSPPPDAQPEATPGASELREMGLEVAKIEGVIAKSKGKGVSKVIQDATKQLRTLLTKSNKDATNTKTDPKRKPGSSREAEIPVVNPKKGSPDGEKEIPLQPPEDDKGKEKKKKKTKMKRTKKSPTQQKVPHKEQGVVIALKEDSASYADMAKKLTAGVDLKAIGVSVTGMRRTKAGHLVLSVGKGAEAARGAAKLKEEAIKVLGTEADVRETARPVLVEILDIGCLDGADDVLTGIDREGINKKEVSVRRIVPAYGGSQRAIVTMSETAAEQLLKKRRVLVGLISCRVRLQERKMDRCFRCHGYGHKAAKCNGPDRTKQCLTCGGEGHLARDCKAPPNCELCKEIGKRADHYPGSGRCEAYRRAKGKEKPGGV